MRLSKVTGILIGKRKERRKRGRERESSTLTARKSKVQKKNRKKGKPAKLLIVIETIIERPLNKTSGTG